MNKILNAWVEDEAGKMEAAAAAGCVPTRRVRDVMGKIHKNF